MLPHMKFTDYPCLTSQNLHYLALLKVDLAYTQRKLE